MMRYAVVVVFSLTFLITMYLWRILLTEQSAIHHQCEHQYVLWPMAIVYQCLFLAILLNYLFTDSTVWAGWSDAVFMVLLAIALLWYFFVFFRVEHICLTFYTIKYPSLLSSPHFCAPTAILIWVSMFLRRLYVGYDDKDPLMISELFYKENEYFVPRLFEEEKIVAYKKGVINWTTSVEDRNEKLKEAYQNTVEIHNNTKSQSQLLTKMTQMVEAVGERATRVESQLKKQTELLNELQSSVDDAEKQLSGITETNASWSIGCTLSDYCKWAFLSLMCCGIMLLLLLAVPRWLHLFGITLGINL